MQSLLTYKFQNFLYPLSKGEDILRIQLLIKNNEAWLAYFSKYISIIEINYKNIFEFEFLIYENNSTDNSKELIKEFMRTRKGKYLCENISKAQKWESGINFKRGLHMNFIRDRAKQIFGKLTSDYIILLDSDTLLQKNTLAELIEYIHYNINIAAVSPYVLCRHTSFKNHYYDTLALISKDNINYIDTDNTCLFKNCDRCLTHRKIYNINIEEKYLFDINSREIELNSVFGCCCIIKTEYYNKCNYNRHLFIKHEHVCEHISFNIQLKNYGRLLLVPHIKIENLQF